MDSGSVGPRLTPRSHLFPSHSLRRGGRLWLRRHRLPLALLIGRRLFPRANVVHDPLAHGSGGLGGKGLAPGDAKALAIGARIEIMHAQVLGAELLKDRTAHQARHRMSLNAVFPVYHGATLAAAGLPVRFRRLHRF